MTANVNEPIDVSSAEDALKSDAKAGVESNAEGDNVNAWIRRGKLLERSEDFYNEVVSKIVDISNGNLEELRGDKFKLRENFVSFFKDVLTIQIIFLLFMLITNATNITHLSDNVLISFMTSVFVETIGCLLLMIKFAFKSDEELKIIETLNSVVKTFQKFKDDSSDKETKNKN